MEKVKIDVAVVGAQQAAQQTKTLKQQIKELRTELEQLTPDTEEYNTKLTELGNTMHMQQEISEQAKRATEDYGQTLSNVTNVAAGVVGSISALNGVMNLMGNNSDDALEAMKKIQSLMAIVQGLNQLDAAEKAFKSVLGKLKLTTAAKKEDTVETIKNTQAENVNTAANTKNAASMGTQAVAANTLKTSLSGVGLGFKKLQAAIKSFMASNPFTLIVLAVTTVYTIISNILGKIDDAREKAHEELMETLEAYSELDTVQDDRAMEMYGEEMFKRRGGNKKYSRYRAYFDNENKKIVNDFDNLIKNLQSQLAAKKVEFTNAVTAGEDTTEIQKRIDEIEENLKIATIASLKSMTKVMEEHVNDVNSNFMDAMDDWWGDFQNGLSDFFGLPKNDFFYVTSKIDDMVKKNEVALDKAKGQLQAAYKKYGQFIYTLLTGTAAKEDEAAKKAEAERQKRLAAWEKAKSDTLKLLQDERNLAKQKAENSYDRNGMTTEQYYNRLIEIENNYWTSYQEWAKKYKLKQQEIEMATAEHDAALITLEKKKATELLKIKEWETDPSRDRDLRNANRGRDRAFEDSNRVMQDVSRTLAATREYEKMDEEFTAAWFGRKLRLLDDYNRESARKQREAAIEGLRIQQETQEIERSRIDEDYFSAVNDENDQYKHDLQNYKDMLEQKLISQQEYEQKATDLTYQHQVRLRELETDYFNESADAELALAETRMQIQQEEFLMEQELFEQKKEMIKSYVSAFSSITSAVSSLLSEVQSQYKEGTKEYEKIAETMLIMQTIEGSLAAFVSGVESGLPAPWNFALGGVLAALATATGVMAINNLKAKKLSSSAANAPNVNPYETLSYETNSNIEGNIQDSRCYVLEEDITSTQNRVSVAETEASW